MNKIIAVSFLVGGAAIAAYLGYSKRVEAPCVFTQDHFAAMDMKKKGNILFVVDTKSEGRFYIVCDPS